MIALACAGSTRRMLIVVHGPGFICTVGPSNPERISRGPMCRKLQCSMRVSPAHRSTASLAQPACDQAAASAQRPPASGHWHKLHQAFAMLSNARPQQTRYGPVALSSKLDPRSTAACAWSGPPAVVSSASVVCAVLCSEGRHAGS